MLEARVANRTQWTDFPDDFLNKVRDHLIKYFPQQPGKIWVKGRIYTNEAVLSLGFLPTGSLRPVNFVGSVELPEAQQTDCGEPLSQIASLANCLQACLADFFAQPEEIKADFPRHWQEITFENVSIFVKMDHTHYELEEQAEQWLTESGNPSLYQILDSEDSLDHPNTSH